MIPGPLHPVPPYGGHTQPPKFPPNWRWDEPLEYTREGFLLPSKRSMIERGLLWIARKFEAGTRRLACWRNVLTS